MVVRVEGGVQVSEMEKLRGFEIGRRACVVGGTASGVSVHA